jgi:hypothetical protein
MHLHFSQVATVPDLPGSSARVGKHFSPWLPQLLISLVAHALALLPVATTGASANRFWEWIPSQLCAAAATHPAALQLHPLPPHCVMHPALCLQRGLCCPGVTSLTRTGCASWECALRVTACWRLVSCRVCALSEKPGPWRTT